MYPRKNIGTPSLLQDHHRRKIAWRIIAFRKGVNRPDFGAARLRERRTTQYTTARMMSQAPPKKTIGINFEISLAKSFIASLPAHNLDGQTSTYLKW